MGEIDWCHIEGVNKHRLSSYSQSSWLTVNNPANGDIIIHATAPFEERSTTEYKLFDIAAHARGSAWWHRNNKDPEGVTSYSFPGLWGASMTAAYNNGAGKVYFFSQNRDRSQSYIRFNVSTNRAETAPTPINDRTTRAWAD
ncbi:MAG: hypothetical protein P8J20_07325 [Novosphingobium sp.]|nr:hypothetical protein [Novosphingobium sp.]